MQWLEDYVFDRLNQLRFCRPSTEMASFSRVSHISLLRGSLVIWMGGVEQAAAVFGECAAKSPVSRGHGGTASFIWAWRRWGWAWRRSRRAAAN